MHARLAKSLVALDHVCIVCQHDGAPPTRAGTQLAAERLGIVVAEHPPRNPSRPEPLDAPTADRISACVDVDARIGAGEEGEEVPEQVQCGGSKRRSRASD